MSISNSDNIFKIGGGGSSAPDVGAINIHWSNKIGIGTKNPLEKLHVNGTILASEVKVSTTANNVPDYVFKEDYHLTSLADLEKYIKTNSHLPEVPSAEEIEANGLELAKMNLLLLKKIEELTLYLIDQEKQIQSLKNGRN